MLSKVPGNTKTVDNLSVNYPWYFILCIYEDYLS